VALAANMGEYSWLREVRWRTFAQVYGNSHATLIGLIVDGWLSSQTEPGDNPRARWALEGGHAYGPSPNPGKRGGMCDALLGEGASVRGIVEVEGSRFIETIEKIGKFFSSPLPHLQGLEFGVFLAYPTHAVGRIPNRTGAPLDLEEYLDHARTVTREAESAASGNRRFAIAVLTLEKGWEKAPTPASRYSHYYGTRCTRLTAALVSGGEVLWRDIGLWDASA
jgi:hypothetical protein